MMDPFNPYDPFDPGSPFCDPYDPFLDPLHPFNDQPGRIGDPLSRETMLQDSLPYHGVGFDTMPGMPWPEEPFPDTLAPDIEPLGPTFGLDAPTDIFDRTELDGLDGPPEGDADIFEPPDTIESTIYGEISGPVGESELEPLLDKLENSIERSASLEIKSGKKEKKRTGVGEETGAPEMMNYQRVFGVPSPDPKIEHKPEKRYERRFPVNLWKPRGHSGLRSSSIPKAASKKYSGGDTRDSTDEKKIRYCPARNGEAVTSSECESCEFFRDGECAWSPEEDAEAEDRES